MYLYVTALNVPTNIDKNNKTTDMNPTTSALTLIVLLTLLLNALNINKYELLNIYNSFVALVSFIKKEKIIIIQ